VVDDFVAAARRGDEAAAARLVSSRDPAFAGRAAVWATNLHRIAWTRLSWTVQARESAVPSDRRSTVGAGSWVQPVTVAWALPGESRVAEETLWLTFVDEATGTPNTAVTRLAGDSDSPATAPAPVPLWLLQPVNLHGDGSVLVLTDATDADQWLAQAKPARRAVAGRAASVDRDPDGILVVEVPQSRTVFERTLGVRAGSYATVGAAAWPMGPDTNTAPIHVVVNPEQSRRLSTLGRDVLLTHEAVHVATRSPGSAAPTWLVEGYADWIAYDTHPAGREPAEESLRDAVRDRGAPSDWPSEDDFAPGAADVDLAYDLAWTAARSIAMAYGDDALHRFYAAVDDGASLAEAAVTIGATERKLLRRWAADLEQLADR
jgi:hypothetical protein